MTTGTLIKPAEIAKETIRQIALRRIVPTPDNYAKLYAEISGLEDAPARKPVAADAGAWADTLSEFARAWDSRVAGVTQARKRETLDRVLARNRGDSGELQTRLRRLLKTWSAGAPAQGLATLEAEPVHAAAAESVKPAALPESLESERDVPRFLRDLLAQAVANAVSERLGYTAEQVAEGAALGAALRTATAREQLAEQAERLRQFWIKLELHGAGQQEVITGLALLLQLLLSNIGELTSDDRWLKGQIEKLRELVRQPTDTNALMEAERAMREVIFRQGTLNHSLNEARQALKEMLASFIDRLAAMSVHTGDFRGKIEVYATRIEETDDLTHLSHIVRDLLSDTRGMQSDIVRAHDDLEAARRRAEEYESQVRDLESRLEHVSGLVCEDQLTSALNRRGLDEAFQKESARCERGGQPLSVAVLDLDNFKNFNDRLGHQAGDNALVHLVEVVREAIRPTDVLGRYGGEEFVILLPDTDLAAAEVAMVRVQRALTRRFFMHNNERLLITFSAGIAQLAEGESREAVLDRADRALYEAKRLGKNRVVPAPDVSAPPPIRPADSQAHSG